MISFMKNRKLKKAVKEALDNLPSGVCFFNANGVMILCNRRMYRLAFLLMGHDLQMLGELKAALGMTDEEAVTEKMADKWKTDEETAHEGKSDKASFPGKLLRLSDGSWWNFFLHEVTDSAGKQYVEAVAFDVTNLREKQELLQEANEAERQTVEALRRIQDNIVAIAREEEILEMKMELHGEFGYHLQAIRHFYAQGCPPEAKGDFLSGQREILKKLKGELGVSDETDSFDELARLANALDMEIAITGTLPERGTVRDLLADALRECLTNAIRHAGGDKLFLKLDREKDGLAACITNNGNPPEGEIHESGGLASLRRHIEGSGGHMEIRSLPEFQLKIVLPVKDGGRKGEL